MTGRAGRLLMMVMMVVVGPRLLIAVVIGTLAV